MKITNIPLQIGVVDNDNFTLYLQLVNLKVF